MKTKTYILDTNVLLSDGNALMAFQDNDIYIPLVVLEELDRHKDRQDDVGKNAREVVRQLATLAKEGEAVKANFKTGISLGDGRGRVIVPTWDNSESTLPAELPLQGGDNKILHFCKLYQKNHLDEDCILVTRDVQLQVKAAVLGIPWETYQRLAAIKRIDDLFLGYRTIDTNREFIDSLYDSDEGVMCPVTDVNPNEFLIWKCGRQSVLTRFISEKKPLKVIDDKDKQPVYGKIISQNKEQRFAVDLLFDPSVKLVTLVGIAGSGKTLLSIAAGLDQVIGTNKRYKSLFVCRPVQPVGKDIGFLPGDKAEKLEPWIAPIKDNLRYLLSDSNGKRSNRANETLDMWFEDGTIEVEAMTYIRGRSIPNAFMIIDEAQNLSAHELKTILTRAAEGTKIVLTGDIEQIDNNYVDALSNGLTKAVQTFRDQQIAGHVTLVKGERSELATLASQLL
jgi:PhoH-like ATPase